MPNSFRLFHQGVDDAVYGGVTGPCQTRTVEEIYQQLRLACDVPAGHSLKQRVSGIACPALLSSSNAPANRIRVSFGSSARRDYCELFAVGPGQYVITVCDGSGVRDGGARR